MPMKEMITAARCQQRLRKLSTEKECARCKPRHLLQVISNTWRAISIMRVAHDQTMNNGRDQHNIDASNWCYLPQLHKKTIILLSCYRQKGELKCRAKFLHYIKKISTKSRRLQISSSATCQHKLLQP